MNHTAYVRPLFLNLALTLLAGCGGSNSSSTTPTPAPLSADNVNLIFVVSPDLAYQAPGDVSPITANLTNQGLQRSLLMATFLQQKVLAKQNVTGLYALEPMTHLQTAKSYPDMAALEIIQQFAVINQVTLSSDQFGGTPYAGHNFPINASYAPGPVPAGVARPQQFCPTCQGIDFNDVGGDNESLMTGIVRAKLPGFYVFSAPWETTSALLTNINRIQGYELNLPAGFKSPNYVYAISITPAGGASLVTYNANLKPPSTYPVLPSAPLVTTSCAPTTPSNVEITGGKDGAVVPADANINETFYIVRHAEAHPQGDWSDNNYVGAGQWRALDLPNALRGKISPSQVWSIDPAQFSDGTISAAGDFNWSSVAAPLTVQPYAIANDLPFFLVANLEVPPDLPGGPTSEYFFTGGKFSDQKVLLGWMYAQNTAMINALFSSYFPSGGGPTAPVWLAEDYDSLWIVTLDAKGNLTADFTKCEGINSAALPAVPPQF